ncbi:MAG: leucyl aminopeptidase family protein [Thiothrix sp.]|nr:leucyl aminopeptidase family protein [Thiothrix sp.]HPQ94522.1 leucyl aminopeptidase family protein [Thiolinea sp.]
MFSYEKTDQTLPILLVAENNLAEVTAMLPDFVRNWLRVNDFRGRRGEVCLLPGPDGGVQRVLAGLDPSDGMRWALAGLPEKLPEGDYFLDGDWMADDLIDAAVGWGLGCYRFDQYRQGEKKILPRLLVEHDPDRVNALVEAVTLVRNLINTPANQMMPQDLEEVMSRLAEVHEAEFHAVTGNALLTENFPAIHAVGRASVHAPRLLELNWGDEDDPLITLVGKGVCFDTGGLDIKSSSGMRLMKKDMGGAAHALGLAKLIMQLELPVSLQVLIPAVDNAIAGDAFRPGDILATRAGKSVEVENTDAEGRLILCDALAYGAESDPDVMIDFATLTGAARVALGTEIPVFFANDRSLMQKLQSASARSSELIWNLPLHRPYLDKLKSQTADLMNAGDSYGGAITAALFLNEFVPEQLSWVHFDVMAWNLRARPGRPTGGEAMGLLAVFEYLEDEFGEE